MALFAQVLRTFDSLISDGVTEELENIGVNLMRRTNVSSAPPRRCVFRHRENPGGLTPQGKTQGVCPYRGDPGGLSPQGRTQGALTPQDRTQGVCGEIAVSLPRTRSPTAP